LSPMSAADEIDQGVPMLKKKEQQLAMNVLL
jgi:hypothetical protein